VEADYRPDHAAEAVAFSLSGSAFVWLA